MKFNAFNLGSLNQLFSISSFNIGLDVAVLIRHLRNSSLSSISKERFESFPSTELKLDLYPSIVLLDAVNGIRSLSLSFL